MNESVKSEFRKKQKPDKDEVVTFCETGKGKRGKDTTVGQHWDKELSNIIQEYKAKWHLLQPASRKQSKPNSTDHDGELSLLRNIVELFNIEFLDNHFPLYGYMHSKTEESPKVYLWSGDADVVGWYTDSSGERKYVIVDWKVLSETVAFWKKNKDAYGKFLHQCLVYVRLLQLHLALDYLPHILIVPINSFSGHQAHPALFYDYPEKCKEMLEGFEWSTKLPEPAQKISGKKPLFNDLSVGKVDENTLLTKLFSEDAKVSDLLEEFGWHSLEVTAAEI